MLHPLIAVALAQPTPYQAPPPEVAAILDAPRPPSTILSPDREWLVFLERPALPPIERVAAPVVKVAGVRLDPLTHGPARENPATAASLRRTLRPEDPPIPLPVEGRIREATFSADGRRLLLSVLREDGIEAWIADVGPTPAPRRLVGPRLQAAYGPPCELLPGDEGLVCRVLPEDRGPEPAPPAVPAGPRVEENLGRRTPARTFADLLQDEHDEALLEHHLGSEVVHVGLDGSERRLAEAGLWVDLDPSPDGRWLLMTQVHRPYSRQVPLSSFPERTVVLERATGKVRELADLPLADDVPITFDSVRTGPRAMGWRADAPATLWRVEALDGGDAGRPAPERDALSLLEAPFDGPPRRLWTTQDRFAGVTWGHDGLALVEERWHDTRRTRTWRIAPGDPEAKPALVWDRSYQDPYSDPGTPVTEVGPNGRSVLRLTPTGGLLLRGQGISPDGVHPFLDRLEWASGGPRTTRLWQAADPFHEEVVAVLDDDGRQLVTRRQSQEEVPNLWLRRGGRAVRPLTDARDWAPAFAGIRKEVVTYTRADGLPLSATVYFPPGHDPRRDGPRPAVFWVYPSEFKRRSDAGQVTAAGNTFVRPGGASHLFFLLRGFVVVDDPVLPIVAEGEEEPNDTYVPQLVEGAEAAVRALADRGWIDPDHLVVGGHSYGAFTTANLLAHTDLFRAGIARSGAYNRTLTPFGFQGEERSFWDATDTYVGMAPFTVAAQVDEPLLLIHGADDANSGTWPIQSERFYEALKGLGAVARWVELPAEDHGYRARESVGHVLWEMFRWTDAWALTEPPVEPAAP